MGWVGVGVTPSLIVYMYPCKALWSEEVAIINSRGWEPVVDFRGLGCKIN